MTRVDPKDLGRVLDANLRAQITAEKRGAVRTLNRAAGMAQDRLIERFKKEFRAPVAFTTRPSGYKLSLARMGDANPSSKFTVKQKQSDYLRLPIEGGDRTPGDAGTSDKFVFKPTKHAKLTAAGSLQRFFIKETIDSFGRAVAIRGGGGGFFGRIGGHSDVGLVARPYRTRTRYKLGRGGKTVLARPSDHLRVSNIGKPVMLVEFDKKSVHRSLIDYDEVMSEAYDDAMADLDRRIDEELKR